MRKLIAFFLLYWLQAQDPRPAIELFRMGRYEEAYSLFRRLFEKTRDYLWGSYAVECLFKMHRFSEYQRWLQGEKQKGGALSGWGLAWEARRKFLEGDTTAQQAWRVLLQGGLSLSSLEALAEVAQRVWEEPTWQREALEIARRQHPFPYAYAEAFIASYERENLLAAAWREWLRLWLARGLSSDSLFGVLQRYVTLGLLPDSAEIALLELWQDHPHPTLAALLLRLYLITEQYSEALRYARAAFRLERDCRPLYEVGWVAYEKGVFSVAAEALRLLIQMGEICPYYTSALARYTEAEALLLQPERAFAIVDSLLRRFPQSYPLLIEKAKWLLRLAKPDSVFALLEPFHPSLSSALAQKYLLLAEAALRKKDYTRSRLYLLEVESRLPQSVWQSEVYFQLARLAYFQGEFELAKTRLRLLKHNTQDDLSNDAIQLFWHIEDNLKPDTLIEPLRLFAAAELLKLQNSPTEALALLDSIQKVYRGHPLTDDILWFKAEYFLSQKDTLHARRYLSLLADYPDPESLYRDDALYLLGELSSVPSEAARYYERLLNEVPGSLYARIAQEKLRKYAR
ncbi:MAG: hypothetical protein RMK19_04720 [Bacteroidia bacterium]|nr:hypothetical protein [Bacteroidia bacterium]MDW8015294.1 hypothetical protein [Bacteroidia bacterium]